MENPTEYAIQTLDEARRAFRTGDHQRSLELYEWFFDHALDKGDASLHGVRLSYCLDEWEKLGLEYAPARNRLEQKFRNAIMEFEKSRKPECFHDYAAISMHVGQREAAIERFLEYHHSDRALAKEIVRFIWDDLVNSEHVNVCGAYIEDSNSFYTVALEQFDDNMNICRSEPKLGGEEFAKQIIGWYRKDVANLTKVLIAAGRKEEAESICLRANKDMEQRGFSRTTAMFSGRP